MCNFRSKERGGISQKITEIAFYAWEIYIGKPKGKRNGQI